MKTFLKIINIFFVTLGVVFFLIILIGLYLIVADPFGLRQTITSSGISTTDIIKTITGDNEKVEIDNVDKNPLLTEEQEAVAESFGIEPENLPTEITPEMEKCFREKLGDDRVNEILKTGQPSAADFFKANSCLN